MKNKFFCNKIFILLLTFLLLVFSFSSVSFGYFFYDSDNNMYNFNDNVVNQIKTYDIYNSDFYVLGCQWSFNEDNTYFVFFIKKTDTLTITFDAPNSWSVNEPVEYTSCSFTSDGVLKEDSVPSSDNLTTANISSSYFFNNECYDNIGFLANGTFYKSDGTIFFRLTPLAEAMRIRRVEEIPQMIALLMRILLPILLSLFGTLLVLFLIKSKNLLKP